MFVREKTSPQLLNCEENIRDYVNDLIIQSLNYESLDRRSAIRESLCMEVQVTPIDAAGRPWGDPFSAVTRDISAKGFSIFVTTQRTEKRLILEFTQGILGPFRVIGEIVRTRQIGPLWELAGKFVTE